MAGLFVPPAIDVSGEGDLYVEISTRLGTIKGKLFEAQAPNTVANFVGLATGAITGVYDDESLFMQLRKRAHKI